MRAGSRLLHSTRGGTLKIEKGTDLKDGVHDARERSVVGMFGHYEDIQSPFVDVLQVL